MEIYVDGGCRGNGKPGSIGAAAACIIKQYKTQVLICDLARVDKKENVPTNQRAEITATGIALKAAVEQKKETQRQSVVRCSYLLRFKICDLGV